MSQLEPNQQINNVDPTIFGRLEKPDKVFANLYERIQQKIQLDPDRNSYPESFAEFLRVHFKYYPTENVLVLPPNTVISGDLVLDWREPWIVKNKVSAIACLGDLEVHGDVINFGLEGGAFLFVDGQLSVNNLIKSGATVMVLESVRARGIVSGNYNDGVLRIGGDLEALAYLLFDHDGFVRGNVRARSHSDDDGDWRDVLVSEVFDDEDEFHPNVKLIRDFLKHEKPIFV